MRSGPWQVRVPSSSMTQVSLLPVWTERAGRLWMLRKVSFAPQQATTLSALRAQDITAPLEICTNRPGGGLA
jgi:hypothetical protein